MNLREFDNYIFDFDGTIVSLSVDWDGLRRDVLALCKNNGIEVDSRLHTNIDSLKAAGINVLEVIEGYEQPNGKVQYRIEDKVISFIEKSVPDFFVISNNLSGTISVVLKELSISHKCIKIVGIDNVRQSKPNIEGYLKVKDFLRPGSSVYIGDKEDDRIFALNCNITFLHKGALL